MQQVFFERRRLKMGTVVISAYYLVLLAGMLFTLYDSFEVLVDIRTKFFSRGWETILPGYDWTVTLFERKLPPRARRPPIGRGLARGAP